MRKYKNIKKLHTYIRKMVNGRVWLSVCPSG